MKLLDSPPSAAVSRISQDAFGKVAVPGRLTDLAELFKLRLTALVLFTVAIGFLIGSTGRIDGLLFTHTLVGTGLLAVGASALNQFLERDSDAQMTRTRNRPLPAGRILPAAALRLGVVAACIGLVYLALLVHPLAGLLGVVTLVIYVFAYTPLKRITTLNTLVGAIAGALPPVIGWAGAAGSLSVGAWTLFLIVFFWQFPHFWSIAWLHRDDYARAGMKMIPVLDRSDGRMTARLIINHCLLLIPASLGPVLAGMAGPRYLIAATALGGVFLLTGFRFLLSPTDARARQVLWASLIWLPVLLTSLLLDGSFLVMLTS